MLGRIKGQGTLEYAMVIAVIVGALLAMRFYMNRGIQGKLRESIDTMGEQYSAGKTTSTFTAEQVGTKTTKETFGLADDGTTFKKGVSNQKVKELTSDYEIKRSAKGSDDKEQITTDLNAETLFPATTVPAPAPGG